MEMLYVVHRKQNLNTFLAKTEACGPLHIKVSTGNIVAFSTNYELADPAANALGHHVYVADLNIPWFVAIYFNNFFEKILNF
jgi:Cu/Ag efflux pump CusA